MPMTPEESLLSLRQDVWEQHVFCRSKDEAVSRAVALVDDRVGDLLVGRRCDEYFECNTGAWLTVAIKGFWGFDFNFPLGFDQTSYLIPPWHMEGVFAAHNRLCNWLDRAVRFRDRPARATPGGRATGLALAVPGRLPAPAPAG